MPIYLTKKVIVVFEDNPAVLRFLVQFVTDFGYWVIPVRTANELVDVARESRPQSILVSSSVATKAAALVDDLRKSRISTPVILCTDCSAQRLEISPSVAAFVERSTTNIGKVIAALKSLNKPQARNRLS
jgi:DNA-binding NtrC family response regulator